MTRLCIQSFNDKKRQAIDALPFGYPLRSTDVISGEPLKTSSHLRLYSSAKTRPFDQSNKGIARINSSSSAPILASSRLSSLILWCLINCSTTSELEGSPQGLEMLLA